MGISKRADLEEYFEIDAASDERLEFVNGSIRSVSGVTIEHSKIYSNLVRLLFSELQSKNYLMVSSQMKLYFSNDYVFCPDIHIYCGDLKKEKMKHGSYALKEPKIIIEILSATTTSYDKDEKFECYRQITSIEKYIMIESDLSEEDEEGNPKTKKEPKVYVRDIESKNKFVEEVFDLEGVLDILGCKINVKDIYEFVL